MKGITLFSFLLLAVWGNSQVRLVISVPENTETSEHLYMAGAMNNWNPADENYKLKKSGESTYTIILKDTGTIDFKFTQGSWEKVEANTDGSPINNRTYTFDKESVMYFKIAGWETPVQKHTAEANVQIISDTFYMPQCDRKRRIWIYLPPDYNDSEKEYPVLYMHDGQNLFDVCYSYSGEWEVDESLNKLYNQGIEVPIVVGIDHGDSLRVHELTPWLHTEYGGGGGPGYAEFIVKTLKPYIDQNYRTKPEQEHTGTMGSSLGGLISYYIGVTYPETFSKLGVLSPSFWFSDSVFTIAKNFNKEYSQKYFMLAEKSEYTVDEDVPRICELLKENGFTDKELRCIIRQDGKHSEWFWRREFPEAVKWLYRK